ncbi:MAG: hypothetical protein J6J33_00235, partial [Clostridia bacterium]|nr:hypothetical protein [Clostridia bacterium]
KFNGLPGIEEFRRASAASQVIITSNNIAMHNAGTYQNFENVINTVYLRDSDKLLYIHNRTYYESNVKKQGLMVYEKLASFKIELSTTTIYETSKTYKGTKYIEKLVDGFKKYYKTDGHSDTLIEETSEEVLTALRTISPYIESKTVKEYSIIDKHNNTHVFPIVDNQDGYNARKDLAELLTGDSDAEPYITNDNYTFYVFSKQNTSAIKMDKINLNARTCELSDNTKVSIASQSMERYLPMYTEITITLAKEYRGADYAESFTGFKLYYDNGESVFYSKNDVGYSFSLVITESVTVSAMFEEAIIDVKDALNDVNQTIKPNETPANPDREYGDVAAGQEVITLMPITSSAESPQDYIHRITLYKSAVSSDHTQDNILCVWYFNYIEGKFYRTLGNTGITDAEFNTQYAATIDLSLTEHVISQTDNFGITVYTKVPIVVNSSANLSLGNFVIDSFVIHKLKIEVTENDKTTALGQAALTAIYPLEQMLGSDPATGINDKDRTNLWTHTISGFNAEACSGSAETEVRLYQHQWGGGEYKYYINNAMLLHYFNLLKLVYENQSDGRIKDLLAGIGSAEFYGTFTSEKFNDGFYYPANIINHVVNGSNSKIDGRYVGPPAADPAGRETNITGGNAVLVDGFFVAGIPLTYNYRTILSIRVYVHPKYYTDSAE